MQNKVFLCCSRPTSRGAPNDARKQSFHLGRVWNCELRKLRSNTTSEYIFDVFLHTQKQKNPEQFFKHSSNLLLWPRLWPNESTYGAKLFMILKIMLFLWVYLMGPHCYGFGSPNLRTIVGAASIDAEPFTSHSQVAIVHPPRQKSAHLSRITKSLNTIMTIIITHHGAFDPCLLAQRKSQSTGVKNKIDWGISI